MHERCAACDERFEREPGQWLGAVYVNLGLTLGLAIVGYLGLQMFTSITPDEQLAVWTPMAAMGPFLFYRLSKGLWTSVVFLGEGLYHRWPAYEAATMPYRQSHAKIHYILLVCCDGWAIKSSAYSELGSHNRVDTIAPSLSSQQNSSQEQWCKHWVR